VIDRTLAGDRTNPWPRWEQMVGLGAAAGVVGQPASAGAAAVVLPTGAGAPAAKAAKPRAPRARKSEV